LLAERVHRSGNVVEISLSPTRTDYFRMLGLEPSAPVEAVRDLYKVLARRLHPDVSGDPATTVAMSRANSIYEALVPKPVPAEFTIESVPAVRRAQGGDEALARYWQTQSAATETLGQLVDVRA
jgi:curved DNA-binding protein CbpA